MEIGRNVTQRISNRRNLYRGRKKEQQTRKKKNLTTLVNNFIKATLYKSGDYCEHKCIAYTMSAGVGKRKNYEPTH